MMEPDDPIDPDVLETLRRNAINTLGVFFDPQVVNRIMDCIVEKVGEGVFEEGIPIASSSETLARHRGWRTLGFLGQSCRSCRLGATSRTEC